MRRENDVHGRRGWARRRWRRCRRGSAGSPVRKPVRHAAGRRTSGAPTGRWCCARCAGSTPCRARSACCWSAGLRPSPTACSSPSATPAGGWRHLTYEAGRAGRQCRRPGPARPRAGTRTGRCMILAENGIDHAADDAGRHACGRAGRAGVDGLRAAEPGLRQAPLHLRSGRAGPDLRRRGGPLCQGAGDDRRDAAWRSWRAGARLRRCRADAVLDADGGAADACRRRARSRTSGPIRSPRSSSPRARPASPRASSTRSA